MNIGASAGAGVADHVHCMFCRDGSAMPVHHYGGRNACAGGRAAGYVATPEGGIREGLMLPELLAEFIGTFVLILHRRRRGSRGRAVRSGGARRSCRGGFTNITIGWGIAIAMATWLAQRTSGAHHPAVSVTLAVYRDFPWRKAGALLPRPDAWRICGVGARLLELPACVSGNGPWAPNTPPGFLPRTRHSRRRHSRGCSTRLLERLCS